jgi:chromate reductase, NAD(P)H dehydrogenase (quinone)
MRILAFAASVRTGSLNRKLIRLAVELARNEGAEIDLAEFREFEMPLYDGDLEASSSLPPGALELKQRVERAEALMISTPEYNYSLPETLKARSAESRVPAPAGAARGLWQTRIPLERCGAPSSPALVRSLLIHRSEKPAIQQGREAFARARSMDHVRLPS